MNFDQVRLIGADGDQLGVVPKLKAFELAKEAKLDLVLVSEQSNPPVCKILDFGKLAYDQKRKQKNQKKNQVVQKLKELRFHLNTDEHDYQTKIGHATEFLEKGNKVKIALVFRGREAAYKDKGFELINRAIKELAEFGTPDGAPNMTGKTILVTMNPK